VRTVRSPAELGAAVKKLLGSRGHISLAKPAVPAAAKRVVKAKAKAKAKVKAKVKVKAKAKAKAKARIQAKAKVKIPRTSKSKGKPKRVTKRPAKKARRHR
jgi:hypothetical protein